MSVLELARPELIGRQGYTSAIGRFDMIRLHANELPEFDGAENALNRYPPPRPVAVTQRLGTVLDLPVECLLLTRGSNEGIDLLVRAFCRQSIDSVVVCPPTFGMYEVCADVQGAGVISVPLDEHFGLNADAVVQAVDESGGRAKLVFLCSPANPTGAHLNKDSVANVCTSLQRKAVVVLDQAYIEFSPASNQAAELQDLLDRFDNLVILRTFSKAYGLAGLRCGLVIANPEIISLLDSLLAPYSTPTPTIDGLLKALEDENLTRSQYRIDTITNEKQALCAFLDASPLVSKRFASDSNFVLIESPFAQSLYEHVFSRSILIRSFFTTPRLEQALRITVGNPQQNSALMKAFEEFQP